MAEQKEHNPGQQPGGSDREDQEKRRDQANPGPQGGEQKSGQGGRETPPDKAQPDKPGQDADRLKQDDKSSGQGSSSSQNRNQTP
jgi:hypothetical protein